MIIETKAYSYGSRSKASPASYRRPSSFQHSHAPSVPSFYTRPTTTTTIQPYYTTYDSGYYAETVEYPPSDAPPYYYVEEGTTAYAYVDPGTYYVDATQAPPADVYQDYYAAETTLAPEDYYTTVSEYLYPAEDPVPVDYYTTYPPEGQPNYL